MAGGDRIDVHHHVLPQFFRDPQRAIGRTGTAYGKFPDWSPAQSLGLMDELGIATAILSFSAPGIYYGDAAQTRDLARRCNEYLADLAARHPGRFGGFACLPLPDVDAALAEIEHALDRLALDGVVHLTAVDDRYVGHPDYRPVYEELDRRGAAAFIHPTIPPRSVQAGWTIPSAILEYPLETTKAVANLLFEGVLADLPGIRFILSHAGGAIPFLAHRIAIFDRLTSFVEKYPEGALAYLRRLYYDTALSGDAAMLAALRRLADPDRILFGTDNPYVPGDVIAAEAAATDAFAGFDGPARAAMERGNAERLFPRFAAGRNG